MSEYENKYHELFISHSEAVSELIKLNKQLKTKDEIIEVLKGACDAIYNIDTMQIDRPTTKYCYKEESEEVHRLVSEALEKLKEMESGEWNIN